MTRPAIVWFEFRDQQGQSVRYRLFTSLLAAVAAFATAAATLLAAPGAAQASQAAQSGQAHHGRPGQPAHQAGQATPAAGTARKNVWRVCPTPAKGHAACMALVRTNVTPHKGRFGPGQIPSGYGPADLQSAYNLPSATAGKGETVAVVDDGDDPTAEADLAVYRAQYGLPPCTTANGCFEKVNQKGQQGNYPPAGSWGVEESLDVDMVSATCPNCRILLVEANSNSFADLGASVNEAVALGAKFVSNSYGSSGESSSERRLDHYFDHPGVAITASAGDSGYGTHFPAVSPYVTSVGGTTLTRDPAAPRGWTESVWGTSDTQGTGSGCSAYEPKPSWQTDTGCANRTDNDVSADADPDTGVAIYDSDGQGGWLEVGGTSAASPLIASTYALAGTPAAGTQPASYLYTHPTALNDITTGTNAPYGCVPSSLCTAGPGYDGPTGLGTPDGVGAFAPPAHGLLTGTVTNVTTGKPVTGATVSADGTTLTTGADGRYSLPMLAGSYTVTVSGYGYTQASDSGVSITAGRITRTGLRLTPEKMATISGTVTDGSGQGWPLAAAITARGVPGTVYSDPVTGAYSLTVTPSHSYTLTVTPQLPDYQSVAKQVHVSAGNKTQDIAVPLAEADTCPADPGYGAQGTFQQFTGWTGTTPQHGWTVTDPNGNKQTWMFGQDPESYGSQVEPPDSDGQYAFVDSQSYGAGNTQDSSLVSPVVNLSGVSSPAIGFDTSYESAGSPGQEAEVKLSVDGGQTWTTVWSQTTYYVDSYVTIPIPQAAGQSDVQVEFTFTATDGYWWSVDNVLIGACAPVPAGLVAGLVTDADTGRPVTGATVSTLSGVPKRVTTTPRGVYEISAPSGKQRVTAADAGYRAAAKTVQVTLGAVTQANLRLPGGDLRFSSPSPSGTLSGTVGLGKSVTEDLTVTNTGNAAASFSLIPRDGSFTTTARPATAGTLTEPAGTGWISVSPIKGNVPSGGSVTVAVTVTSGAAVGAAQPGSYTAGLAISSNAPDMESSGVPVTMTVRPPKAWGEVTGAISGATCGGPVTPLSGATAELITTKRNDSLIADSHGRYAWWLPAPSKPLTVAASLNGWAPQAQKVQVTAGQVATADFTLQPATSCSTAAHRVG